MAITVSDLLAFNATETTDLLQGIVELPYFKPIAFIPGVSFSKEYEDLTVAQGGRGSQAVIRRLGKGTVKSVKATASNALDFDHQETADDIEVIPIDDVVSKSEKIYEAVEVARQSATGAKKAEIVLNGVVEEVQEKISGYLTASVPAFGTTTALTPENTYDQILAVYGTLDKRPTTLAVNKAAYNNLLHLVTTGYFIANSREDAVRTGILGNVLGMNVVLDPNLEADFVMYDYTSFPVFNIFNAFEIVDAKPTFIGSFALAQMITGGGRAPLALSDDGLWGIKYIGA